MTSATTACVVHYNQAGNGSYNAAPEVTETTTATTKALTVSGVTANNKVYDTNTTATLNTASAALVGVVGADVVTLDGIAVGVFADENVGTGKTVTVSGLTLGGADVGNYTLTQPTASANITTATLTVSGVTADNKVYDGNTTAVVNAGGALLVGILSGDTVTLDGTAVGAFSDKNVDIGETVTISGLTLGGADADNYSLTQPTTNADITALLISGSITADNKIYDGNTSAVILTRTLSGEISGDDVAYAGNTATFDTKNVGTGKTVTGTGMGLSGPDAPNYIVNSTAVTTADITARSLTVSATADNKTYDGTTDAVAHLTTDAVSGDNVVVSYTTAAFDDKNVGTGKTVHVSGITLDGGTDVGNYVLHNTTADAVPIEIVALSLTGSITVSNKTYDGDTHATTTSRTLSGVIAPDDVTISGGTATFDDKNVGTAKPVSSTGLTLGGADMSNYTYDGTASTTADITKKDLPVYAFGIEKVYDGNTSATAILFTDALVDDDEVTASSTISFEDKNVGTDKPVHVTGLSIGGLDGGNYELTNTSADTIANITTRSLTVSATADNKTYDGTTDAVAHLTSDAVLGDDVAVSYADAAFDNKDVSVNRTVHVSGISVTGGTDAGNYALNNNEADVVPIEIVALSLTGGITVVHKPYDGDTSATVTGRTLTGVIAPDDVTYDGGTAAFDTRNAGTGKMVTGTGLSLIGHDKGNYTVNGSATTTADITPLAITVTALTNTKTYDGTTNASSTPTISSGTLVTGDTAGFIETYDNQNVGTGKTLMPSGAVNDGNGGANYNVTFGNDTTGTIEMLSLTLTADPKSKVYGASDPALTYQITSGALASITDSFTGALTRDAGEIVGTYPITPGTLSAGTNYDITFVGDNLTITTADITVTADAQSKMHGDADPALTYQVTSGALATGDSFTGTLERVAGEDIGTYAINKGTLALNSNYNLTYAGANLTINKATPVITWANPADITYPAPLSATELNATASVAGVLTYDPVETTVLNAGNGQALMVHFVPDDPVNYNETDATVYINVLKVDPVITWANPAGIFAGTPIGASELNATADVDGTFDYDPASGTIFTVAGDYTLSAHFTPTDTTNYNNADKEVALQIIPTEIVALQLTASPTTLAYDQTSELTVTGKDQYNNTVTNNNSTVVVLSADGGGSLGDSLMTLNAGVAMTHLSKDSTGTSTVTVSSGLLAPAAKTVVFTATDTSNPEVESHNPLNGATGVAIAVHPTLTFSEPLKATTVTSANIQLRKVSDDSVIPATVSIAEGVRQVNITPTDALDFNTEYYFAVSAGVTDEVGNPAIVLDSSTKNHHKFTTLVDTTVLAVTGIDAVRTSATADDTFENGWAWTFHVTVPTGETLFAMKFSDFLSGANSVPAGSNIRFFSAQSSDASATSSAMTITAADTYSGDITLAGDLSGSLPGRQIDVTVEVKVPVSTPGGSYSASYGVRSQ